MIPAGEVILIGTCSVTSSPIASLISTGSPPFPVSIKEDDKID